jgi:predicted secreted Zn-dependent protease
MKLRRNRAPGHCLLMQQKPWLGQKSVKLLSLSIILVLSVGGYFAFSSSLKAHASGINSLRTSVSSKSYTAQKPAVVASTPQVIPATTSTDPTTPTIIPSVPNCTPDNSYSLPSSITPLEPGLQQIIDTPSTYTVYGDSPSQIMSEIDQCTPVHTAGTNGAAGNYAASTANTISWSIEYTDTDGQCSITNADVTLHISQVFPEWQATGGSPSSLNSLWQNYITKLVAYEQGHVSLDETAANAVLSDLQNLPTTSCSEVNQVANSVANNDANGNLAANANYDNINDFGLNEGVVL